jgi:MoxR-like ATPase
MYGAKSLSPNIERQASPAGNPLEEVRNYLNRNLVASETLVEKLLICLLADGHVLVEGPPGLAKTRAAKLLASKLDLTFSRIQCTPDLMPADVTGTSIWRPDSGVFKFIPGPIFNSLLLVDEINRAPPKVQSALLEAMAERQATVAGETRKLPEPFMTIATQNPIEHEGTFPLPEAQLDRFMLQVKVDLPNEIIEREILDLVDKETLDESAPTSQPLSKDEVTAARLASRQVFLSPAIKDYIVRLVTAPRNKNAHADLSVKIEHPASPRGTLALAAAAKARAYICGRDYVAPDDISALAIDVLSHRTILSWRALSDGDTARDIMAAYLDRVPLT